jgi:hypothetical protein
MTPTRAIEQQTRGLQVSWSVPFGSPRIHGMDDMAELARDENKARKAALAAASGSMFAGVEAPPAPSPDQGQLASPSSRPEGLEQARTVSGCVFEKVQARRLILLPATSIDSSHSDTTPKGKKAKRRSKSSGWFAKPNELLSDRRLGMANKGGRRPWLLGRGPSRPGG